MFTLRCTQKLLRGGLSHSQVTESPPTTMLGDWYANVLYARPRRVVLCISEQTLLPVVLVAKPVSTLPLRLPQALAEVLQAIDVDPSAAQIEIDHMREISVGRTNDRGILGNLNQLMFLLETYLRFAPESTPLELSLRLAHTPCTRAKRVIFPDQATRAAFFGPTGVDE